MRRGWIVSGVALLVVLLVLLVIWWLLEPAPKPPKGMIDWDPVIVPEEMDDWTDLIDLPYDQAVARLRSKYGETFPIMVLREGTASTTPVDKSTFYMWVDGGGIVTEYTYEDDEEEALLHGGIVRQYDRVVVD